MIIALKNNKPVDDVWCGMTIQPGQYYFLEQIELNKWANDHKVIQDIVNGHLIVSDGVNDIIDINNAINYIKGISTPNVYTFQYPFAQKITKDGKRLFRRKHGVKKLIQANSTDTINFIVPYTFAKINQAEIINCSVGDVCDLKVYDNSSGTISGVPNLMLNQFGFNVIMPNGMYVDQSNYDADLIQGMKIELTYTNNSSEPKEIGFNITLHQLI